MCPKPFFLGQKLFLSWAKSVVSNCESLAPIVTFLFQPMEVYVDDEAKLTLHGLQQHYCKLKDAEKNRKLFELLDVLEFNQVSINYF